MTIPVSCNKSWNHVNRFAIGCSVHLTECFLNQLHGEISIETAALTSTVRQAVRGVEGVLLRDVEVGVAQQRSENVLEVRLVVEPGESCKLMSAARAMQEACKRSLESFTEHRVATVAVDYVQGPDSHRESAAKPSPDGLRTAIVSQWTFRQKRSRTARSR